MIFVSHRWHFHPCCLKSLFIALDTKQHKIYVWAEKVINFGRKWQICYEFCEVWDCKNYIWIDFPTFFRYFSHKNHFKNLQGCQEENRQILLLFHWLTASSPHSCLLSKYHRPLQMLLTALHLTHLFSSLFETE